MSGSEKAAELVLKAIEHHKKHELKQAIRHFEEAIKAINYAIEFENYGSTGKYILKERLEQYTKKVNKLRAQVTPEIEMDDECDFQPMQEQTTAEVHSHDRGDVVVASLDEPDTGPVSRHQMADLGPTNNHQPEPPAEEGLFRLIPGEADYKHLETAINFAKRASQADQENSLSEALDLYNKAIDFFYLSTNKELTTEAGRRHVRPQVEFCQTRAEVICRVLLSDRSGYLTEEELQGQSESISNGDDPISEQATLQRRTFPRPELVGLDIVRSVLLDAATSDTTSFRKILLVGAQGTGKTTIVENIFRDADQHYLYRNASVFTESNEAVHDSINELFENARQKRPCIMFFDNIDAVFPPGGYSSGSIYEEAHVQLIKQLTDWKGTNNKIIFISATDCPWYISPVIRERFDTIIYTQLPTKEERVTIAKLNAQDVLHNLSEEDFLTIAELTQGYTGADIKRIMTSAVVKTIEELHKATHFKQIHLGGDTSHTVWTPCSPNDPAAVAMLLSEVVKIHPPEVTMRHVMDILEHGGSSVSATEVYRLRDWVFQTGKAPPEQQDVVSRGSSSRDSPANSSEWLATSAIATEVYHQLQQPESAAPQISNHTDTYPLVDITPEESPPAPKPSENQLALASGVAATLLLSEISEAPESLTSKSTAEIAIQTDTYEPVSQHSLSWMSGSGPMSIDASCQTYFEDSSYFVAYPTAQSTPIKSLTNTQSTQSTSTEPADIGVAVAASHAMSGSVKYESPRNTQGVTQGHGLYMYPESRHSAPLKEQERPSENRTPMPMPADNRSARATTSEQQPPVGDHTNTTHTQLLPPLQDEMNEEQRREIPPTTPLVESISTQRSPPSNNLQGNVPESMPNQTPLPASKAHNSELPRPLSPQRKGDLVGGAVPKQNVFASDPLENRPLPVTAPAVFDSTQPENNTGSPQPSVIAKADQHKEKPSEVLPTATISENTAPKPNEGRVLVMPPNVQNQNIPIISEAQEKESKPNEVSRTNEDSGANEAPRAGAAQANEALMPNEPSRGGVDPIDHEATEIQYTDVDKGTTYPGREEAPLAEGGAPQPVDKRPSQDQVAAVRGDENDESLNKRNMTEVTHDDVSPEKNTKEPIEQPPTSNPQRKSSDADKNTRL